MSPVFLRINLVSVAPEPSFLWKVTFVPKIHCAYNVSPAVGGVYLSPPIPRLVPPDAAVYQPLKILPSFIGAAGSVTSADVSLEVY